LRRAAASTGSRRCTGEVIGDLPILVRTTVVGAVGRSVGEQEAVDQACGGGDRGAEQACDDAADVADPGGELGGGVSGVASSGGGPAVDDGLGDDGGGRPADGAGAAGGVVPGDGLGDRWSGGDDSEGIGTTVFRVSRSRRAARAGLKVPTAMPQRVESFRRPGSGVERAKIVVVIEARRSPNRRRPERVCALMVNARDTGGR
jgi:hypothetical protein